MPKVEYHENVSNRDVISLFSGAMGLDIGLGLAGLNIRIGQDVDVSCIRSLKRIPPCYVVTPVKWEMQGITDYYLTVL